MAQVPYSGVPTVAPSTEGQPTVNVPSPLSAFGGGVAQAVSESGNEIFQRAIALQQLRNETEAKDADIKYMIGAGQLHAEFNALEGEERVKAFPAYSKNLQDLYKQTRGSLSNPMAQRMFDSTAVSTMSRSIFNGAGAAATAQKEWTHSSSVAETDLLSKRTFDDPTNDAEFESSLSRVPGLAQKLVSTSPGGWSQEAEDAAAMKIRSQIVKNRISGVSRAGPQLGYEYLDKYGSLMTGADYKAAEAFVTSQSRTKGSDIIGNDVLNENFDPATGTYKKSFTEMQTLARNRADELYGKRDPEAGTYAAGHFDRLYNQRVWAENQDRQGRKQEVAKAILEGAKSPDQMPPNLIQRMTDAERMGLPGTIYNVERSKQAADDLGERQRLLGMYNNDNAKFMDENILANKKLNIGTMKFFIGLQRQANPNGDPRVSRAMRWLTGARAADMRELGLMRGDKFDANIHDQFTGAIHEALQAYQEVNGKAADEKAVVEQIWPSVVKSTYYGRTIMHPFSGESRPFFEMPIPDEEKEKIANDPMWEKQGHKPTDNDLFRVYWRSQYQKYFGGSKPNKDQSRIEASQFPQVPVSE